MGETSSNPSNSSDENTFPSLKCQLQLLHSQNINEDDTTSELATTPIFTKSVHQYGIHISRRHDPTSTNPPSSFFFTQYGLLGGQLGDQFSYSANQADYSVDNDPRVFHHTAAPSSTFICGSQGSGKSHTLSCLLENCLAPSAANVLPRPLTGVVFHYDAWVSDAAGSPCEAAYLSSDSAVKVRVLCSPTNIELIKRIYSKLANVKVEPLRINESDLNTKRMLDLMAVSSIQGGGMPLYLHMVLKLLREMRLENQQDSLPFNYRKFKDTLMSEDMSAGQKVPLQQRLDTLESFMVKEQTVLYNSGKKGKTALLTINRGNDWTPQAGQLTIVDLSCPCITAETACSLFNMCLGLFLEQSTQIGRVVALDEAHKYMTENAESQTLTDSLLAAIRLQRHLAARVIISTQEPTISPRLLDLCSVTIVHRFSSPAWLQSLKLHLAGASIFATAGQKHVPTTTDDYDEPETVDEVAKAGSLNTLDELFGRIVALRTGEALIFAPSALIGISRESVDSHKPSRSSPGSSQTSSSSTIFYDTGVDNTRGPKIIRQGHNVMHVRIRKRVTWDGGKSIMAS